MKLFLKVCENLSRIGITSDQNHRLNQTNALSLFFYGQFVISTMWFFFVEAETIDEYAYSFYAFITGLGNIWGALVTILKMQTIFGIISNIKNCIDEREHPKL